MRGRRSPARGRVAMVAEPSRHGDALSSSVLVSKQHLQMLFIEKAPGLDGRSGHRVGPDGRFFGLL